MESLDEKIYGIMTSQRLHEVGRTKLYIKLGAQTRPEKQAVDNAIRTLEDKGLVTADTGGTKIMLVSEMGLIKARLQGNAKGFAFAVPEDRELEDLFIPARKLNGAMHSDIVLVKKARGGGRGGSTTEGEVIKVLERGFVTVVGKYAPGRSYGFVLPDDSRFGKDIFIPKGATKGSTAGDKVLIKLTSYGLGDKNPEGEVLEVLGQEGTAGVDILSIIRAHNLYEEFPEGVKSEAANAPEQVSEKDKAGRRDLTGHTIITIDGSDAKDLDDAVEAEVLDNGNFLLGVHIADVTHYVKAGSKLDKEAMKRATSVYFPDRVLPMLPRELSNGICSLNPKVDRLALSVFMEIDPTGKVVGSEVAKTVIRTTERMTYDVVTAILEGDGELGLKYKKVVPMLKIMEKLMHALNSRRSARGSVDFEIPECKIILDEAGKVADILPYPRGISNRMIEEFMLITNETVAEQFYYLKAPFVYRVHESPTEEKTAVMAAFVEGLGLKMKFKRNEAIQPKIIQEVLAAAADKPVYGVVSKVMLRSMQKARYHYENLGHFGLAAKFYSHFTSPIRRYPDLAIHRIIKSYLDNGMTGLEKYEHFVEEASIISSEREKLATDAEREVDDLKKAEFLSTKLGESFEGIISGVTGFGVFVELANTCEGIVRLDNLPQDSYNYDETKFALIGNFHIYRLGDKINITVAAANVETRRVEFVLSEDK